MQSPRTCGERTGAVVSTCMLGRGAASYRAHAPRQLHGRCHAPGEQAAPSPAPPPPVPPEHALGQRRHQWQSEEALKRPLTTLACSAGACTPSTRRLSTLESARHDASAALRTDSLMSSTARSSLSCSSEI